MTVRSGPWAGMGTMYRLLGVCALASLLLTFYNGSSVVVWIGWLPEDAISGPTVERSIGYLVRTNSCTIPEYSARDPSIVGHLAKPVRIECNPKGMPPLTYTAGPHVHINVKPSVLTRYWVKRDTLVCCYKEITRITESLKKHTEKCDDKFKLSACIPIDVQLAASPIVTTDGVLVTCSTSDNPKKIFYKNVHYFFQHHKAKRKIDAFKGTRGNDSKPLNFMIVGIDSVSRQNMKRYMPETFRYLTHDNGVVDFMGYNKVADNTDPNVTPIITGAKAEDFQSYKLSCYKSQKDNLDECPFIWKNFSSKGYVTVYAEDAPYMGLYHYKKIGFVEEPTDYYIRPYYLVSEKQIGNKGGRNHYCQGLRQSPAVIYDHALRALDSFQDDVPVFGYYWTASTSHANNELTAPLDKPTVDFFRKFVEKGYNNNTIVFFISDHGMRFGTIRSTYLGAMEERLPFAMMLFPPWFRKEYPQTWRNLQINRRRLINNYDLHLTIVDILGESYAESSSPETHFGLGQSLFLEVPTNRTCESCGIPTHFCVCQTSSNGNTEDKDVIAGANSIVKNLNQRIYDHPECAKLDLNKVIRARVSEHKHDLQKYMKKKKRATQIWRSFTIVLETKPGGGQFEGTVLQGDKGWKLADDVSRINLYGNQSICIEDVVLKKFCYCFKKSPS